MSERPLVLMVAPPFAGHLHPTLGIGRRLSRELDVIVASTEAARPAIEGAGLASAIVLAGEDARIEAIANPPHAVGSNPRKLDAQLRENLALFGRFKRELHAIVAQRRPSLVIADFTVPVAGLMAREERIPWWTTHASPCAIETPDGPPGYMGGWHPRDDLRGRLRDAYGRTVVRTFKRSVGLLYRKQLRALGLPALYRPDGTEAIYSDERLLALGLEALELRRTWPRSLVFVGPVLYTPPSAAREPPFREGRRHVLFTIGTHLLFHKDEAAAHASRVAERCPDLEIHFSDGDVRSDRRETRGNFHRLGYVPYARDLGRYALVVHHAGAGVMYHALRHRLPALVTPLDYDQFDHAVRLERAGVARRLGAPETWAAEVRRAIDDEALRAAAQRFGEMLDEGRAEDRVGALVTALLEGRRRSGRG